MFVLGNVLWILGVVLQHLLWVYSIVLFAARGGVLGQRRSPAPASSGSCAWPPIRCSA